MSEIKTYRHPITNRIKRTDREAYARTLGFEVYDGEIEVDKTGVAVADLSKADLVALAEQKGLPTTGTKAILSERLATASSDSAGDTE